MSNVGTATSSPAADDGAGCRRVARSATRKSIRPPARARSGSGMPYLVRVLWPRIAANTSAKLETSVARTAMLRANLGSARSVIFAKGPTTLKGPSIRKRKVKIWSVGTGFVHGWLPVAPAAKAILLEDAKPIHTISATIRRNLADAPSLWVCADWPGPEGFLI